MTHPALLVVKKQVPESASKNEPLLLNKAQAAKALNISEKTLDTWVIEFDLPKIQIGRSVRFSIEALKQWITDQAERTQAAGV